MHCIILLLSTLLTLLVCPYSALADGFGWLDNPTEGHNSTRLYLLDDAAVERSIRLELIASAKQTIRMVQADAELDPAIVQALQAAVARGVKLHLIKGGAALPALSGARTIVVDPVALQEKGTSRLDSPHEKILLIDDKIALVGHRGKSLSATELAALVVEPRWGGMIGEVRGAFDQLWYDLSSLKQMPPVTDVVSGAHQETALAAEAALSPDQMTKLDLARAWLQASAASKARFDQEARPSRLRIVTHRFYDLLSTSRYNGARRAKIPDEIANELVRIVENAHEVRISTPFALFNPKLRAALVEALKRGARLSLQTDVATLAQKDSLENLTGLMKIKRAESGAPAHLRVSLIESGDYAREAHRKIFLADNYAIFGSYDYNLPASLTGSGIVIEAHDAAFAQAMTEGFDHDFQFSSRPLTITEVERDYPSSSLSSWFAKFVESFF